LASGSARPDPSALNRLDLSSNQLTSVSAGLGALTALTRLTLSGNQLESLPAELGALTALTTLKLHKNRLTSVPAELGALTALELLDLRENLLTSVPAEVELLAAPRDGDGDASALRIALVHDAFLSFSSLADVNALRAWREQCPELRALWDESKPATAWAGVTFGSRGDLGRVIKIELKDYGLTGDVPAAVGGLTALTRLVLSENQLTSVPAELGALTALELLSLGGNLLTSVPAELGTLTALRRLYLSGNQVTSVPAELGGLTALTRLDIDGNPLMGVPAEWEQGGALDKSGCMVVR